MARADAIAIIPARLGSTRFPGKVLARETGRPLIQHVCETVAGSARVGRVVVATDDETVQAAVEAFGGECLMTSPDHPNGTSRLAEACDQLGLDDETIIVNVQGDEPELDPRIIDETVAMLEQSGADSATAAHPFEPGVDPADPHHVKVVQAVDGRALYFSRSLIPHSRDGSDEAEPLHHLGLYVYRRRFLRLYRSLEPTPLERTEKLEQLRVLEHGYSMAVAVCDVGAGTGVGIDTPEQYRAFVARWRERHAAID